MKYEVRLHYTEIRTETVECDSPKEAIVRAKNRCAEGFQADEATEILDDGEAGKTHVHAYTCENCEKWLWEDDEYEMTLDDCALCPQCADGLRTGTEATSGA